MKMYTAQEMRVRADYLEIALADAKTAAMLRQAADMMEREEKRERKYEYAAVFFRNGNLVGMSAGHYDTLDEARIYNALCPTDDTIAFVCREVDEWKEVSNEQVQMQVAARRNCL